MSHGSSLGINKLFSIEFVVDFFDRSRNFYAKKMGFVETHHSTPEWEALFHSKGVFFTANDIRVLVVSPTSSHGYTAEFLKILSPGIRRVTFQVSDLDKTIDYLADHDATFLHGDKEFFSKNTRHRFITITTPIGFLEFTFLQIDGDEDEIPMFEKIESAPASPMPSYLKIDHLTINSRTLYPVSHFFEHVMDLKKFWTVAFHTPDFKSGKKGTGLSSKVMWDPQSKIKFATNDPLYPHFNSSQIQTFINQNHGAGIQHIALEVDNLIDTARTLRSRGIEFLDTPDSYYNLLPERMKTLNIGELKEDLEELKSERILVDGKNGNYLLQIFLKDASLLYHEEKAGPFFYELIQRHGHEGFGEGNFRALFEAIEYQAPHS
ncbi:MAG: VOC family protein [Nitrospinales bacterium]